MNCIPSVTKWGDLLRIYSTKPTESQTEADQHEKEILALKGVNKMRTKEPNHELLGKLRSLMKDIHAKREKVHNLTKPDTQITSMSSNHDSLSHSLKSSLQNPTTQNNYFHTYFNHSIPVDAVIQPSPTPGEPIMTKLPILDL